MHTVVRLFLAVVVCCSLASCAATAIRSHGSAPSKDPARFAALEQVLALVGGAAAFQLSAERE